MYNFVQYFKSDLILVLIVIHMVSLDFTKPKYLVFTLIIKQTKFIRNTEINLMYVFSEKIIISHLIIIIKIKIHCKKKLKIIQLLLKLIIALGKFFHI